MRKRADEIKEGKKPLGILGILSKIRNAGGEKEQKESKKEQEQKKHNFSQQQLSDFDKKMDDELFQVKMRTIATSPDKARPKKILDDIARLFNQYNYIGLNTIKFTKAQDLRKFAKHYVMRLFYSDNTLLDDIRKFNKTTILNIKELSSIIHFPHGRFNQNPRIAWQKFKIVPAPDDLPSEGIVVGYNNF
jgi:hypothetical protein